MASTDLIRSCIDSIRQISDQLADSILYLDAGCLEAFQFIGAFPALLELGVHAVCSLENASPLDMTTSWNSVFVGPTRKVIAHSAYIDSPLGPDAFNEYESLLIQDYEELLKKSGKRRLHFHQEREAEASENDGWADLASGESYQSVDTSSKGDIYADDLVNVTGKQESKKLLVSVHHFPMILCPLSPRVFVLPSEGTVAEACLSNDSDDSVSPGLPSISTGLPSDGEDVPPGATLTANFLYHLAAKMNMQRPALSYLKELELLYPAGTLDALLLSMIGYILAGESFPTSASSGPFSWEEEHSLKEAVVDAVMENPSSAKLHFLHGLCNELEAKLNKGQEDSAKPPKVDAFDDQWGSWDDEEADDQNEQAYGDMQLKLELRDRRRNLTLREGLVASSKYGSDADTRKGLLYKLLTTLLAKYDVPGLEYHSSAVGRFLKSGFGRFGLGQAKPSFGDQNVLLVFVVGGINNLEIREAVEAVAEYGRPDIELIVGVSSSL
ncbi:Sec1 family [Musa troglodytarum]|uniref:Sec1 family n=1 Tax=Musa troglodytarum TaxID=320322 RepID=A0A9E7I8Y7_9LILI|nr:Sec1 family [Musa troglodytarum]